MKESKAVPGSFWDDKKRAQRYLVLYEKGLTHAQIGAELGCSKNASVSHARILGLPVRVRTKQASPIKRAPRKPKSRSTPKQPPTEAPVKAGGTLVLPPRKREIHGTKPRPAPPPPKVYLPGPPEGVQIWDLELQHCRWPMGEPSADMLWCGKPKMEPYENNSYCEEHFQRSRAPNQRGAERRLAHDIKAATR
jgi:hypothetical protein